MKNAPFEYHAPRSVDEVLALLAEHGDEAKILAGGQSLVPLLAMRLARPSQLVDINEVGELDGIRVDDDHVSIGGLTRERDAERSSVVAAELPVLTEALPMIGHVAIRNRGTIGGSIAHADASAELPAIAVATDAQMVVRSAKGERTVNADDFFVSHFTTSMDDDELLTEVRLPRTQPEAGWAFEEIARRHGDFALVGVAAMITLDGARIGEARITMMGVAERALRATSVETALVGQAPDAATFADAARDSVADLEPASDMHGSAEFRRHLAGVAVRRALTTAARRAEGTS